jgi:hypothetical protein
VLELDHANILEFKAGMLEGARNIRSRGCAPVTAAPLRSPPRMSPEGKTATADHVADS